MKITGDLQLMKKMNKALVLDTIRHHFPISRADISVKTGLNKTTVSSLVNELIESHFVTEIGLGESSGGRKPMMLLFNQRAGYALGVDLGVNYMLAMVTDLGGTVVKEKKIEMTDLSVETVTEKLKKCIHSLIKKTPASPYGIIGIGVGVPGLVDDQGNILSAPNLGWTDVPLQNMLQQEFNLPIAIDNEANVGALGEKEFGAGRSVSNMIYLSVGIGIGAGIILNDALYRGVSGFSGEVGHMTLAQDGPLCGCGSRGCWETFASEKALLQQAKSLQLVDEKIQVADAIDKINLNTLLHLAKRGNRPVMELFANTGHWLGVGITNLVNVFNPGLIVIGNRMSLASEWIAGSVRETLNSQSLSFHRDKMNVVYAKLGMNSSAVGAASMAINRFFSAMKAFGD
ncbi:ROK family transcriptional regulator [Paenibacillus ehimensis]|uniref:ROK family transcriptional regulator n=1 Tax=Paenibacillus ehimensis TaxID=79264 RepID=A0ABT8VFH3_9BACL|nr:ROK family transcriptional regulator [Paenibacillus ehimensis]MDO3679725.1 ROK family transcriptional regulator [Paenibacillus ehimensis]